MRFPIERQERLSTGLKNAKEILTKDRYPTHPPFVKMGGLTDELNLLVGSLVVKASRLLKFESSDLEKTEMDD